MPVLSLMYMIIGHPYFIIQLGLYGFLIKAYGSLFQNITIIIWCFSLTSNLYYVLNTFVSDKFTIKCISPEKNNMVKVLRRTLN